MIIKGKTLKGKNRIREAGTDKWEIINNPQKVQFSKGLWVMIEPSNGNSGNRRWVRWDEDDQDFELIGP